MNHVVQELSIDEIEVVAGSTNGTGSSSSLDSYAEGIDVPEVENNPPG